VIKHTSILTILFFLCGCGGGGDSKPSISSSIATSSAASTPAPNNWTLVWSDEFDGSNLDTTKWSYEENCKGNGEELQCYTSRPENVAVSDGNLHIKVRKENFSGPAVWNDEPGYDPKDTFTTLLQVLIAVSSQSIREGH